MTRLDRLADEREHLPQAGVEQQRLVAEDEELVEGEAGRRRDLRHEGREPIDAVGDFVDPGRHGRLPGAWTGVWRHSFYAYFQDEQSLFMTCSGLAPDAAVAAMVQAILSGGQGWRPTTPLNHGFASHLAAMRLALSLLPLLAAALAPAAAQARQAPAPSGFSGLLTSWSGTSRDALRAETETRRTPTPAAQSGAVPAGSPLQMRSQNEASRSASGSARSSASAIARKASGSPARPAISAGRGGPRPLPQPGLSPASGSARLRSR